MNTDEEKKEEIKKKDKSHGNIKRTMKYREARCCHTRLQQ